MAHREPQDAHAQAVPLNPLPQGQVQRTVPLGPDPCRIACPSCSASITTTVRYQPTSQTHLIAVLLCCICFPCVCLPYLMDSCQSADHYCPNCDAFLGSHKR